MASSQLKEKSSGLEKEKKSLKAEDMKPDSAVVAKRKLLIWVTGGKGGTGKSTFARGLLDLLLAAGLSVAAFDGDIENAQLFRYYEKIGSGVVRTVLADRDGGDDILAAMEEGTADVIIADVAAGGTQILGSLQDESMLLSVADELGYDITVVSVITASKDSINTLRVTLETTAGFNVNHVVVKNLFFDDAEGFELFEESETRKQFSQVEGVILPMRSLLEKTYKALDRNSLPFSLAKEKESGLPMGDRARVRQWLTCLDDELRAHGALFGL